MFWSNDQIWFPFPAHRLIIQNWHFRTVSVPAPCLGSNIYCLSFESKLILFFFSKPILNSTLRIHLSMHSWMGGKHNDSWFGPYQFWVPLQNSAHILSSWLKEKLAADISMHKINSNILLCVWNNLSLLYISTSKFYNEKKKGEHITYLNILFKKLLFSKKWN